MYNCLVQVGIIDATPISVLEERVVKEIARCIALIQDTDEQAHFIHQEEKKWKEITGNEYYQSLRLIGNNVYAKHFSCRTLDRLQLMYPSVKPVSIKKAL